MLVGMVASLLFLVRASTTGKNSAIKQVANPNNITIPNTQNTPNTQTGNSQKLFCSQCGNKLKQGYHFCSNCGAKI